MKFKILIFLFSSLISSGYAQQASCDFAIRYVGGNSVYSCGLILDNPDGNEITEIEGIHLEGFTDADVLGVVRINGSMLTPFPSLFCDRFTNIQRISVYNAAITGILSNSFFNCPNLIWLSIFANPISSIGTNAFSNNHGLIYIDLDSNQLTSLDAFVFINQSALVTLDIRNNQFNNIAPNAFAGLTNLTNLYMQSTNTVILQPEWFENTPSLANLYLGNNFINEITSDNFRGLGNLETLNLYNNRINIFNPEVFSALTNLVSLSVGANGISELTEESFIGLENLVSLDLANNLIQTINNGTFRALRSLRYLYLNSGILRNLESDAFIDLPSLENLNLNFNQIEDLPPNIFATLSNVTYLGLWNNRIKTLNRHYFGADLSRLLTIDLDGNVVNALERSIFEEALALNTLFFSGNLCANGVFSGFQANRVQFMERLERCFSNFELLVEAVTDNNLDYLFFRGEHPGFVARVQAEDEIHIALTPFNFPWTPMIEVIIGTGNNTRSVIRRNQEEDVAVVPTPNIIRSDELNLFRVVWANHLVMVFRGNEEWPFLVHTLVDFFPVNFYGLRTPQSRATWSIQPVGF